MLFPLCKDVVIGSVVPEVSDPSRSTPSTSGRRTDDEHLLGRSGAQRQTILLNDSISIVPEDVKIRFSWLDIGRVLGHGKSAGQGL